MAESVTLTVVTIKKVRVYISLCPLNIYNLLIYN